MRRIPPNIQSSPRLKKRERSFLLTTLLYQKTTSRSKLYLWMEAQFVRIEGHWEIVLAPLCGVMAPVGPN